MRPLGTSITIIDKEYMALERDLGNHAKTKEGVKLPLGVEEREV